MSDRRRAAVSRTRPRVCGRVLPTGGAPLSKAALRDAAVSGAFSVAALCFRVRDRVLPRSSRIHSSPACSTYRMVRRRYLYSSGAYLAR